MGLRESGALFLWFLKWVARTKKRGALRPPVSFFFDPMIRSQAQRNAGKEVAAQRIEETRDGVGLL